MKTIVKRDHLGIIRPDSTELGNTITGCLYHS